MRTTVELPDALIRRAKLIALQRNTTLKAMITEALEKYLDGSLDASGSPSSPPDSFNPPAKLTRPMVDVGPDSPIANMDTNASINKEGKTWNS